MKRKIIYLCISLVFIQIYSFSQVTKENVLFDNTLSEGVYLHVNTATLFTGESIYYSVYCINISTGKLSSLSKIAYVELIGENNERVFNHKIKLKNGTGYGNYKIPIETPSGNYKIIGYTQWMRNADKVEVFQNNITIINPYKPSGEVFSIKNQSIEIKKRKLEIKTSEYLKIKVNRKNFKKRSKVILDLSNKNNQKGNYSISVRKVDEIDLLQKEKSTSISVKEIYKKSLKGYSKTVFLPELRGELITGRLIRKTDKKPVSNKKIALSINQKDFILKISTTNEKGVFYFNLNERYSAERAVFQMLSKDKEAYDIVLDSHDPLNKESFVFGNFKIPKKYNKIILERSIYNQIENGYQIVKQDSLIEVNEIIPFFGNYDEVYKLDDFKRFSALKDVFIEIINNASIVKKSEDEYNFSVKSLNPYLNNTQEVAVIVDGVLLQDYFKLINSTANKFKKISIKRTDKKLVLGNKLYDGFIVFETYKRDFNLLNKVENRLDVRHYRPEIAKKYFKREYVKNESSRIPDFRNQLFWEPSINIEKENKQITFFTSDNIGTYEISVEGFTNNGDPVSLKEYIIVE
jgi:hypothetical protein